MIWIWLRIEKRRLKNITKHPKIKLAPRYYGPFKILQKINDNAFRLGIPSHWQVHNSFHISLLKPFKGTLPNYTWFLLIFLYLRIDAEILVPETILDHDKTTTRTGLEYLRYLVKYQNHSVEESQWIQKSSLTPAYDHLITAHHSRSH